MVGNFLWTASEIGAMFVRTEVSVWRFIVTRAGLNLRFGRTVAMEILYLVMSGTLGACRSCGTRCLIIAIIKKGESESFLQCLDFQSLISSFVEEKRLLRCDISSDSGQSVESSFVCNGKWKAIVVFRGSGSAAPCSSSLGDDSPSSGHGDLPPEVHVLGSSAPQSFPAEVAAPCLSSSFKAMNEVVSELDNFWLFFIVVWC
ncbi:hypothetical protein KSP40_PGU008124 [Platanthera guangdongensis]|uniref:Uncharacterized protein n=1 Tax=Platanthera guangdongensis TaxID=2320717 RepID=A0ABR2M4V6_9ASPA